MSISLELLTRALAKAGFSSSQEEEILTAIKDLTDPPRAEEEPIVEEPCVSDDEQLFEQKIEEDEEGVSSELNPKEHHVYESFIEQWFQVSTQLDDFRFCFYLVKSHFQKLIFRIFVYPSFHFAKLNVKIFLFLLREWLSWKYVYT